MGVGAWPSIPEVKELVHGGGPKKPQNISFEARGNKGPETPERWSKVQKKRSGEKTNKK